MKDELTIYYSVGNCGDGSAYPTWFETAELAGWNQEHQVEGWCESCTGSITVKGSNLSCDDLQTKEGYYLELLLDDGEPDEVAEFKDTFFPNGLPEFVVGVLDERYYGVYYEGKLVYKKFAYPEKQATLEKAAELEVEISERKSK